MNEPRQKSRHVEANLKKTVWGFLYTKRVADILSSWAIQSERDRILEPSFGGCEFLKSARSRLLALGLGTYAAENRLYGCDIDQQAFDRFGHLLRNPNGHFKQRDFLTVSASSFPKSMMALMLFSGILPYVSHHHMSEEQKQNALNALRDLKNVDSTVEQAFGRILFSTASVS